MPMIPKTRATKVVDEWYKKREECVPKLNSERPCSECEFRKETLIRVTIGSTDGDREVITSVPICEIFQRAFADKG